MQKCSHTHLHRSDPNEASDRDRSSEKNNEGKPRENTLYMLKLCRNTELFRNIMNDSVQDLLWLVDIQHIHTHTASMLCYASFKSLGLSFWHCTFRCHQRRCICVTFFFSSSVRYLVNRTMNAGMYAFTMAWSTEQMQTQSDVFWDILRIHQWYTTIVFEWSMTKKNIYPEKNTPTLKQFKFVFEKDLFILYLPFLTKSPWILTIILSHTNALNAKAFSEWNISRSVCHINQILFMQHFWWPKNKWTKLEYEQNNLWNLLCEIYTYYHANHSANNANLLKIHSMLSVSMSILKGIEAQRIWIECDKRKFPIVSIFYVSIDISVFCSIDT